MQKSLRTVQAVLDKSLLIAVWLFGFQCHMELTKEVVASLIENDDLSEAANYRFVNEPKVLLNHDYDEMNQKLHEFLDKLTIAYQAYS